MEVQDEKIYKSKKTVREAMKRYKAHIKENEPEKYDNLLKFHRAYNKEYYKKIKAERAQLKQLLEQLETKV